MRLLHISAIPVWSMAGKGGMPSLRETLRGHLREGGQILLILPRYHLFDPDAPEQTVPADCGFEVRLAPCTWIPPLLRLRRALARLTGRKEIPYLARWVLNLLSFLLMTCSLTREAAKVIYRQRRRFDLVYAHNQYAALAGWIIGKMQAIPNVTRLYGTFLAELISRPLVWLRYPVAAAGYLVPSDLLICANDGTRGDVVARKFRIPPGRFRFWQNGVDPPAEPPRVTREEMIARLGAAGLRADSRWVLSCSRLSYWKRIDRILPAVAVARHAGCDCQLLLAGDGPERPALERLADELDIAGDIAWLGAVAHADIWALMHLADVFIITNDVTNRCNPLYEAICAGLPVVSIRHGSTADLLDDGGNALLAEPDDPAELGECLRRVLADDALADRLRAGQRQRAGELWTWPQRMAAEVAELRSLVAANRTRSR